MVWKHDKACIVEITTDNFLNLNETNVKVKQNSIQVYFYLSNFIIIF